MAQNHSPEGDRIYDLYTGVYTPQLIRTALELDVFSPLDPRPANVQAVAQACGCETIGIHYLLDYLASLNVLVKQNDEYSLSPEAATFLVRGKKSYAGDLITYFASPAPWNILRETIRSGKPHNFEHENHFAQDAWIESYRGGRIPGSLEMWTKAGIVPGESRNMKLLDIACGCAIKSLTLLREAPGMELTCLDTPGVLESARDLAERWEISSRVHFMPTNLLTADLGQAQYDLCLVGQVTHYLTEQQNSDLFERIHRALVAGGLLVVDVPMGTEVPSESSSFLTLMLWANSGGRAYSFEEYRSWLLSIGFKTVNQLSERLLSALK